MSAQKSKSRFSLSFFLSPLFFLSIKLTIFLLFSLSIFSCQTLHRIEKRMDDIEVRQVKNEENLKILRDEIDKIRKIVAEIDARVSSIEERVARVSGSGSQDISGIKNDLSQLSKQVDSLRKRVETLETRTARIENERVGGSRVTREVQQVAPISEDEAQRQIASARDLMVKGDVDKAVEILNSLLMRGYNSYELRFTLGDAFFRKEDYKNAIRQWLIIVNDEEKIGKNDILPRTYLRLANAFLRMGDTKNARLMLEAILSKYPQSPESKTAENILKDMK